MRGCVGAGNNAGHLLHQERLNEGRRNRHPTDQDGAGAELRWGGAQKAGRDIRERWCVPLAKHLHDERAARKGGKGEAGKAGRRREQDGEREKERWREKEG